jgi:hypothetical protein
MYTAAVMGENMLKSGFTKGGVFKKGEKGFWIKGNAPFFAASGEDQEERPREG